MEPDEAVLLSGVNKESTMVSIQHAARFRVHATPALLLAIGSVLLAFGCDDERQVSQSTPGGQPDGAASAEHRDGDAVGDAHPDKAANPALSGPKLASRGPETNPYLKEYEFTRDAFTSNLPIWESALESYKDRPNLRYLEIGLFEGRSALWMLEQVLTDPSSSLVGIDPFGDPYGVENVEGRFYANLKKSGAADRVEVIKGFSQIELRKLPLESFDIVYIDGSHRAAHVLEDSILSYRLLKEGGILIFDDYLWWREAEIDRRPEKAIDIFYHYYGEQFEVVHADYQVILRRRSQNRTDDSTE